MQIGRIAAHVAVATGKAVAVEPKTTEADAASDTPETSKHTATAEPVTGGIRTTSLGYVGFELNLEAEISFDFADIVAEKTRLMATTLKDLFKGLGVRSDESLTLSMNNIGEVTASGPGKEKIEALFHDNPELAKQLKEVMVLQSMLAMKKALDKWQEARKAAKSDDERDAADQSLLKDLGTIKALRNTVVLSPEGDLTSMALAYMNGAS